MTLNTLNDGVIIRSVVDVQLLYLGRQDEHVAARTRLGMHAVLRVPDRGFGFSRDDFVPSHAFPRFLEEQGRCSFSILISALLVLLYAPNVDV